MLALYVYDNIKGIQVLNMIIYIYIQAIYIMQLLSANMNKYIAFLTE